MNTSSDHRNGYFEPNDYTFMHKSLVEYAEIPTGNTPGALVMKYTGEVIRITPSHAAETARALGMPVIVETTSEAF